jgi:7-cyano-7-deazaguanine synthase in queuosine biosynthesis
MINEEIVGYIGNQRFNFRDLGFTEENVSVPKDLFVKLSILTTIAGYLKNNKICINSNKYQKVKLEKFLSYILNNKKFAPMNYNIKINFLGDNILDKKSKHNYDCVILFSGGFDSTAALLTALDKGLKPLLLWVGFGQKNENEEHKTIKNISKLINFPVSTIKLNLKDYINLGWKEWDYIIPARNFMFVAFAASFLSKSQKLKTRVYLSAHEEEIKYSNTDKSIHFFKKCTNLFSDYYKKEIIVETPFMNSSKAEIASYWKNKWIKKYNISPYDTISCYYGNNCGECKACLKRTIAFLAAGLHSDPNIKINPMKDSKEFLAKDILLRFNQFSKKRKMEILTAIRNTWDIVPDEIKKMYNNINKRLINNSINYEIILKRK